MNEVRDLQQKYVDGQINRRDFIKAVGALGIAVSAAGSLLKATDAMGDFCKPCPAGQIYNKGSKKCAPKPRNRYLDSFLPCKHGNSNVTKIQKNSV